MSKVTNIDTFKYKKEVGLVNPPTRKEVMDKIDDLVKKYDELDLYVSRIIDDIDNIKDSYSEDNEFGDSSWKREALLFRLAIASDVDKLTNTLSSALYNNDK